MRFLVLSFLILSTAYPLGHWDTRGIENNYRVHSEYLPTIVLANYIDHKLEKNRRKNLVHSSNEIATKIIITANCLEIDPYYFAGLIRGESEYFTQAGWNKPGNGKGLTQMTSSGIHEVLDQVGYWHSYHANRFIDKSVDRVRAKPSTIEYFDDVLHSCLNIIGPGEDWVHLWDMPQFKNKSFFNANGSRNNSTFAKLRMHMLDDITSSIVYGGIHLKIQLVKIANESPVELELVDLYELAIKSYNSSTHFEQSTLLKNSAEGMQILLNNAREYQSYSVAPLLPDTLEL
jgi:hypothetical protein